MSLFLGGSAVIVPFGPRKQKYSGKQLLTDINFVKMVKCKLRSSQIFIGNDDDDDDDDGCMKCEKLVVYVRHANEPLTTAMRGQLNFYYIFFSSVFCAPITPDNGTSGN